MKKYKLCLETDYKNRMLSAADKYDIVVIDAQDYTKEEINSMKSDGVLVLTYLNVGAIESERPYFTDIRNKGLLIGKYENWDGEWWVRADKNEWREHIANLSMSLMKKGVDGYWVDNLDVYYMADEEWGWSSTDKNTLYSQLKKILKDLHNKGFVMVNGGDVFVSKLMEEDTSYKGTGLIDAINQETVFSSITNYSGNGTFGKQNNEDKEYYKSYIESVSRHNTEVFLLEYTKDNSVIAEAKKYCEDNDFTLCVSSTIKLGGDIPMGNVYEVSGTTTPSKVIMKTGLLKNGQKVTARKQPKVSASPCSFSPVNGLTRIDVCDTITDNTGKKWCYCKVNNKYGFILYTSIRDYLRVGGKSVDTVAKWVIDGDFGNDNVRINALKKLGYNPDTIQAKVNEILGAKPQTDTNRIRVWPIWFFEKDEDLYGDCTAIIEYGDDNTTVEHCILIDTAKSSASSLVISKLKAAGVKKIDAFILSHGHGDHYGGLTNIMNAIPINTIYVPDTTELAKYQSSYASAIKRQASKFKSSHYLKAGSNFTIGNIKCEALYQAPASSLSEHDDHHFVNNESIVLRFTLNGTWTFHTAGDLQNEGNNLLVKSVKNLNADIFKCQWHGDANACNENICKAIKPKVAFSNYHHTEQSGRGTTRKRLEAVGAVVARNSENGDIYIDCVGNTMKLSCSKNNLNKTFTK